MNSDNFVNFSGFDGKIAKPLGEINILAIGIGGAGGNIVLRMIESKLDCINYAAVNTDQTVLNSNPAPTKIAIGKKLTRGLGAGMKPEIGRKAAMEDIEDIKNCLEGVDMLFIAAGMGGGTGTGAAPVVAQIAKELDILTIAVVTTPFEFEGTKRARLAKDGIEELKKYIDTLILIHNNRLIDINPEIGMDEAFVLADEVLQDAIFGVSNLVTGESQINLDFADIKTVLENQSRAFIGIGTGKGEFRGEEAAKNAMKSPVLNNCMVQNAKGIIIHVDSDNKFSIGQIKQAVQIIKKQAAKDADIIFGYNHNANLKNEVQITIIAGGFDEVATDDEKESINDEIPKHNLLSGIKDAEIKDAEITDTEEIDEDYITLKSDQIIDKPNMSTEFASDKEDVDIPTYLRNKKLLSDQDEEED